MPHTIAKKQENQTAETEPVTEFKILHGRVELQPANGIQPATIGDIAQTSTHGIVARSVRGTPPYDRATLFQWNQDLRMLGSKLGEDVDGLDVYQGWWSRLSCNPGFQQCHMLPIEAEVTKFASMFPALCEALGYADRFLEKPIFDAGFRQVQKGTGGWLGDWQPLLRRHVEGDWGENGVVEVSKTWTDEELFLMPLLSVALRNTRAIQTRKGCVQSKYIVMSRNGAGSLDLNILSVFPTDQGVGTRTLCWMSPKNYR